jgi:hypothetical protein
MAPLRLHRCGASRRFGIPRFKSSSPLRRSKVHLGFVAEVGLSCECRNLSAGLRAITAAEAWDLDCVEQARFVVENDPAGQPAQPSCGITRSPASSRWKAWITQPCAWRRHIAHRGKDRVDGSLMAARKGSS